MINRLKSKMSAVLNKKNNDFITDKQSSKSISLTVEDNPDEIALHIRGGRYLSPEHKKDLKESADKITLILAAKNFRFRILNNSSDSNIFLISEMRQAIQNNIREIGLNNDLGVRIAYNPEKPEETPHAVIFDKTGDKKISVYKINNWEPDRYSVTNNPFLTVAVNIFDIYESFSGRRIRVSSRFGDERITRVPSAEGGRPKRIDFMEKRIASELEDLPNIIPVYTVTDIIKKRTVDDHDPELLGFRIISKEKKELAVIAYTKDGRNQSAIMFPGLITAHTDELIYKVAYKTGLRTQLINNTKITAPPEMPDEIVEILANAISHTGKEAASVQSFLTRVRNSIPDNQYIINAGIMPDKGEKMPGKGLALTLTEENCPPLTCLVRFNV